MKNKEKRISRKPVFIFLMPIIEMFVLEYITGHFFSMNNILNILYRFSIICTHNSINFPAFRAFDFSLSVEFA